jgi:hypothetical protein
MTRLKPNLEKVKTLFNPDENGFSDWKTIQEVIDADLKWSGNGAVRRGVVFGVGEYIWEFERVSDKPTSKITKMRLAGISNKLAFNQTIRKDIREELLKQTRSNFAPDCIVPLVQIDKEIDHRWGRKDHPTYEYINDPAKQTIDDFQLLSHSHNQFKREQCKKCSESNIRYDGKEYTTCAGCPLAQPELYY